MREVPIYPPIADYALLSDCHSCALVSTDGSIDWCTFHRFEARPVFGRILDWGKARFFRIAPLDDDYEPTRRYLPGTNVLETTFRTPTGTLVLTDFFSYRVPDPGEDAHSAHPDHQLIRGRVLRRGRSRGEGEARPTLRLRTDDAAARDARGRPRGRLRRRGCPRAPERAPVRSRGALGDAGQPHAAGGRGGLRRADL